MHAIAVNAKGLSLNAPLTGTRALTIEQFLSGIQSRAFRFAELGLRNRDDALDAVQDAMLRMLRYADKPVDEWQALFWKILRTRIIDISRRRAFRFGWLRNSGDNDEDSMVAWADPAGDPSSHNDGREAYALMALAIHKLPTRQREAFTLRVLEDLDVATTASVMGCSEGSVKTHLSRARDALRTHLQDWT
ncbi:RNA polymerase sigma factor [Solilutibacter silvestris]|uniref:Sigma70-ECF: RNA polymerase sigma factor, sigma-70 family n=1 Tax=Solilutibacter silvestris TaxID=1645665 RepID=A0A2K1PXM7_9GAMM|nr:RNA polymerase sigma factor [Lysobacter silvestris]PNS07538.1 sigma70-ECF: RNA polymerase sigma factor, sigma-70 family [Lysobacter silvestris]